MDKQSLHLEKDIEVLQSIVREMAASMSRGTKHSTLGRGRDLVRYWCYYIKRGNTCN